MDDYRPRWPSDMSWEELVLRARLGEFERALLFHNSRSLGERCSCVGSIRALSKEEWLTLPWMDRRTHERVVDNIRSAALQELA